MSGIFPIECPGGITLTGLDIGPGIGPDLTPEISPEISPGTGPAAPRRQAVVLLLHGFPEAAFAWEPVIRHLQPHARCVAPNLRGYAGSSAPSDVRAYRARPLLGDLQALVERLGAPVDLVLAHDWGGALAWALAAASPHLMRRLLILNAPHPATFLRELLHNPSQQAASAYMNFLCRPDAAALLSEDDFRRLWPFFTNMGADNPAHPGGGWLTDALRERYREVWRAGLEGPLNYYRASPLRPATSATDPIHAVKLTEEAATVRVPTTVMWGEADTALPPGLIDGLERWVPDLQLVRVPQATHWIAHEQPDRVARLALDLLER